MNISEIRGYITRCEKNNKDYGTWVPHDVYDYKMLLSEIDRLKAIIETLVDLSLWCGIISRGEACRCLGVDRCDLDDWLAEREKKKELIGALREKLSIIADQVEYGLANEECSIGCLQAIKKAMEVGE